MYSVSTSPPNRINLPVQGGRVSSSSVEVTQGLAGLAREASCVVQRRVARLCEEALWISLADLRRRRRGGALPRVDRQQDQSDRRYLLHAGAHAAEVEERLVRVEHSPRRT